MHLTDAGTLPRVWGRLPSFSTQRMTPAEVELWMWGMFQKAHEVSYNSSTVV